jgi:hypothetical protein
MNQVFLTFLVLLDIPRGGILYNLIGKVGLSICYGAIIILCILVIPKSLKNGLKPAVFSFLFFVFFVFEHLNNTFLFGGAFNINSVVEYVGPISIFSYYAFENKKKITSALRVFFIFSVFYMIFYVLASKTGVLAYFPNSEGLRLPGHDFYLDSRVYCHSGCVLYALFYCSYYLRSKFNFISAATFTPIIILSVYCMYLSDSRLASLAGICVFLATITPLTSRMLPKGSWYTFVIMSAVALFGVLDTDFNFYALFGKKASLSVRAASYDIAIKFINENFLFGVGIPGDIFDAMRITRSPTFSASDIGIVGVFFNFGVIGVFFYSAIIYAVCSVHKFYKAPSVELLALEAVGYWVAIVSFVQPQAFIGQGAGLTAMLVAMYMRGTHSERNSTSDVAIAGLSKRMGRVEAAQR